VNARRNVASVATNTTQRQHHTLVVELDPRAVKSNRPVTMHREDDLLPRRPAPPVSRRALYKGMGVSTRAGRPLGSCVTGGHRLLVDVQAADNASAVSRCRRWLRMRWVGLLPVVRASSGIGLATECQHRGKASHWIRGGTRDRSAHPKVLSSG
jgi:hypothetical protein